MNETLIVLIVVGLTLWGLFSILGIVYPVRPFSGRKGAVKSFGVTVLLFIGAAFLVSALAPKLGLQTKQVAVPAQPPGAQDGSALRPNVTSEAGIPDACGEGGLVLGDVVAVTGEHDLHAEPGLTAPWIKNEKASTALGEDHFHQIDSSTTVRRICVQSEWTQVQIATPDWLTFVTGWVPNTILREIALTRDGGRVYVEEDFYWDDDTSRFKPEIVAVVNKIAGENRNCAEIDPSSVAKSVSRSQPGDPVFFVTCGSGAEVFNVWFKPSDKVTGNSFTATEPLARNAAVDACETAAKAAAMHPSTVNFSHVWDLAYMPHVSGRARVVSSFTARNALNLELKYRIDCLFDGAGLIETQISESFE